MFHQLRFDCHLVAIQWPSCCRAVPLSIFFALFIHLKEVVAQVESHEASSKATKSELSSFVSPGFMLLDSLAADLNADGRSDFLVVLQIQNEAELLETSDSNVLRPLLILLRDAEGRLYEAARNANIVLCANCGGVMGDPYVGLSSEKSEFTIEHYGGSAWRWSNSTTFRYVPELRTWLLQRVVTESFHVNEPEKVERDIKTEKNLGRVRFEEFNNYEDEK
jgi:hypothetical protein